MPFDSLPGFLRLQGEFKDHRERRQPRPAALRPFRAMPHRGKGRFNGIDGSDVYPVLGREIIKGKEGLFILLQALAGLLVLDS